MLALCRRVDLKVVIIIAGCYSTLLDFKASETHMLLNRVVYIDWNTIFQGVERIFVPSLAMVLLHLDEAQSAEA
jgi:hypothetical protein